MNSHRLSIAEQCIQMILHKGHPMSADKLAREIGHGQTVTSIHFSLDPQVRQGNVKKERTGIYPEIVMYSVVKIPSDMWLRFRCLDGYYQWTDERLNYASKILHDIVMRTRVK